MCDKAKCPRCLDTRKIKNTMGVFVDCVCSVNRKPETGPGDLSTEAPGSNAVVSLAAGVSKDWQQCRLYILQGEYDLAYELASITAGTIDDIKEKLLDMR